MKVDLAEWHEHPCHIYYIKKNIIQLATVIAEQLLLVDVVMRAGKSGGGGQGAPGMQLE